MWPRRWWDCTWWRPAGRRGGWAACRRTSRASPFPCRAHWRRCSGSTTWCSPRPWRTTPSTASPEAPPPRPSSPSRLTPHASCSGAHAAARVVDLQEPLPARALPVPRQQGTPLRRLRPRLHGALRVGTLPRPRTAPRGGRLTATATPRHGWDAQAASAFAGHLFAVLDTGRYPGTDTLAVSPSWSGAIPTHVRRFNRVQSIESCTASSCLRSCCLLMPHRCPSDGVR